MEVSAVYIERTLLVCHGFCNTGVCVPDTGHVVVHINVTLAVCVVEYCTLPSHDMHWLFVEQGCMSDQGVAAIKQGLGHGHGLTQVFTGLCHR